MLPPRRDIDFQLFEVLGADELCARPRYQDHDRATFEEILESTRRLAEEWFLPFGALTDEQEPEFIDGRVHIAPEALAALTALRDSGFFAAPFNAADGGLQVPYTVVQACNTLLAAAHVGFFGYAMLTTGVANVILTHGSDDQKRLYGPPLLAGLHFGTMCLSETQAGSSLSDISTRAERRADGRYRISGDKMWISGGDHDLAQGIVHLVLARVPGGPPGVKGISLFIVPRDRPAGDAGQVERNGVQLVGLNHKMGWRGTVNTVLSFGRDGDCIGELIGEEHRGLEYMFQLMNEARIGVGTCSVALGYAGYRNALDYARQRPQGRPLTGRDPAAPQVPILRHADVRRMLLAQKAWVEGGLALVLYCARLVDELATTEDAAERRRLNLLLELLTPIAKSWPSEFCLEANKLAIQVLGGYGYTRDYPLERLYRDNRLNHIHEGTYGIHGLDLLGRKVQMQGGAALQELERLIRETIVKARAFAELQSLADALECAIDDVMATTAALLEAAGRGEVERALANATLYLEALGQLTVAWRWLEQALVAQAALPRATPADQAFYRGKLGACRYFFHYELPRITPLLALLRSLDDTALTLPEDAF